MQDYTFLDDYDYTECTQCHSHIQPYNNTSITTIMTQTTTTTTTTTIEIIRDSLKKSANSFTRTLLNYHHLHCEKCGLYIEIHPKCDDEVSEKIFICSNTNNNIPHKYCLCYHCGLLYGINPNAKSIDIISILQTQIDNMHKNKELTLSSENQIDGEQQNKAKQDELNDHDDHCEEEEEHSLESREVNDNNGDCSEDDSVDNQDRKENNNKIDESYMNILALKEKLSNIQTSNIHNKTVSCPSSPNTSSKFSLSNLPQSLRGSPLLGPSTPSPRVLGRDVDEIWEKYKLQKKEERLVNKSNVKDKLQEQQSQIDNLQELLKQIQDRKKQAIQGAKMFAGKPYVRGLKKNDI